MNNQLRVICRLFSMPNQVIRDCGEHLIELMDLGARLVYYMDIPWVELTAILLSSH